MGGVGDEGNNSLHRVLQHRLLDVGEGPCAGSYCLRHQLRLRSPVPLVDLVRLREARAELLLLPDHLRRGLEVPASPLGSVVASLWCAKCPSRCEGSSEFAEDAYLFSAYRGLRFHQLRHRLCLRDHYDLGRGFAHQDWWEESRHRDPGPGSGGWQDGGG